MNLVPALWLQDSVDPAAAAGLLAFSGTMMLIFLAIAAVFIVGAWKVFVKAGQPGWACIIPFYNIYILTQIAGRPAWWLLLFFIPIVNLVPAILISIDIAKAFGQSAAFGVILLFLLGGIGYLVLGFGNYRYQGPAGMAMAAGR